MREEQLSYLDALANDLDSRGEIASSGMVRRVTKERRELLAACEFVEEFLQSEFVSNPNHLETLRKRLETAIQIAKR